MARQGVERRLAAILSADVVGYSRLMGEDEAGTLAALKALRKELFAPTVAEHHGRIVKLMGDGALVEFPSVVDAVECAVAVQRGMTERNAGVPKDKRIAFRIGVNLGDIIIEGSDIYGHGVNIAARLQELSAPGGITLSATAHEHAIAKVDIGFRDGGEHELKNIAKPVRIYHWSDEDADGQPGIAGAKDTPPLPDKPSIAVLPFDNMSGDPEQEFLGDGITEDVITTLSKIPDLVVIARNSTFAYKGQAVKVQDVAHDLGVRYVLEGSVRRSGNRLRLTAQLIDAADGHHIWAERYDREVADIFAIQDDITRNIAIAIQGRLMWGYEAARWQGGTQTFQAWECQMRGMHLFGRFTREGHAEARMLFEKAVEIDPDYLMAWVMLGACHSGDVFYGWSSDTAMSLRKAEEFLERALSVDASLAQGHAMLADLFLVRRDHEKAVGAGERAVALAPSGSEEHAILAMVLVYADRPAEALMYIKRATRLDPHYPANFAHALIHGHRLTGDLEKAREMALDIVHRYPDYWLGRAGLAAVCADLGLDQEAYAAAQEVLRYDPEFSIAAHSGRAPFKDPQKLDEYLAALRKAGLPE